VDIFAHARPSPSTILMQGKRTVWSDVLVGQAPLFAVDKVVTSIKTLLSARLSTTIFASLSCPCCLVMMGQFRVWTGLRLSSISPNSSRHRISCVRRRQRQPPMSGFLVTMSTH
jgi:hypothetical protein